MNASNSVLIACWEIPVGANPVYSRTSRWAEPDLDAAAHAMLSVYENEAMRRAIGARAARDIAGRTDAALGRWMVETLGELQD